MAIGDGMSSINSTKPNLLKSLDRVAPAVALVTMLSMFGIGGLLTPNVRGTQSTPIHEVLTQIPGQLASSTGTWVRNRVVPVPSSQVRLLDLTAHVSLEYLRLGEFPPLTATLFIAYCNDARSMVGHHPPNCYPSSGWLMDVGRTQSLEVERDDGRVIPAKIYWFSREGMVASNLQVVSGFFSPGEVFSSTLEGIVDVIKPNLLGGSGLFQFQILLQGDYSDADVKRYATEILDAIPEAVFDQAIGIPKLDRNVDGLGARS